ncbi:MAG: hypothetical protein ACYTF7_02045 [Planctomycetota bacterium]|jgi:hypothetical protein
MRRTRFRILMVVAACSGLGHRSALAQPAGPDMVEVDPGIDDIGTLGTSQRLIMRDLRLPSGFDRVFQLGDGSERFVRINGALRAVFPRSSYDPRDGYARVPAGTIYYIGSPDAWDWAMETNPLLHPGRLSNRFESRLDGRVLQRAERSPGPDGGSRSRPTMWSSESYRRQRLSELVLADAH